MTATPAPTLDIWEALRAGWRGFVGNLGPLLLLAVVAIVLSVVVGVVFGGSADPGELTGPTAALGNLVSFLVNQLIAMVAILLALTIIDGHRVTTDRLVPSSGVFVSYVLGSVLFSIMLLIGFVLLVIPALIVGTIFGFYGWAIIDHGHNPIDGLRHSAEITRGNRWTVFGFFALVVLLNVLGALALGVGLLVAYPVTFLATGHVYRQLDPATAPAI